MRLLQHLWDQAVLSSLSRVFAAYINARIQSSLNNTAELLGSQPEQEEVLDEGVRQVTCVPQQRRDWLVDAVLFPGGQQRLVHRARLAGRVSADAHGPPQGGSAGRGAGWQPDSGKQWLHAPLAAL